MISVKEAAELARKFGSEIFEKYGTIEEVELQGKYWLITLGYEVPKLDVEPSNKSYETPNFFKILSAQKTEKNYKTFKINGETKEIVSAKMHKV